MMELAGGPIWKQNWSDSRTWQGMQHGLKNEFTLVPEVYFLFFLLFAKRRTRVQRRFFLVASRLVFNVSRLSRRSLERRKMKRRRKKSRKTSGTRVWHLHCCLRFKADYFGIVYGYPQCTANFFCGFQWPMSSMGTRLWDVPTVHHGSCILHLELDVWFDE